MLRTPVSRVLAPLKRVSRKLNLLPTTPTPTTSTPQWGQLVRIDDHMRGIEHSFGQMQRWMDSMLRDFAEPMTTGSLLRGSDLEALTSLLPQPEIVKEGEETKYRVLVGMGNEFTPENVKVTLKDGVIKIDAKVEQKSDDGSSRIYREVMRQFTLPKEIDLKTVKTIMEPNGVLKIEAPIPEKVLKEIQDAGKPKEIPIAMEG